MFRYLYAEVGRAFHWTDRLSWTDADIERHLSNPGVSIWRHVGWGDTGRLLRASGAR